MTRSTALGEERLNMQSWDAISISGAYECVPAEVRARCISNYPCHGGSRHRGGDKWNLHVVLTGGETERLLLRRPSIKSHQLQGRRWKIIIFIWGKETINIPLRFKQVWENRIEGMGEVGLDSFSFSQRINKSRSKSHKWLCYFSRM